MNYLLDTCVLSEFTKRQPEAGVVRWVGEADETGLFLSVLSIGEIKPGIARPPASPRKAELNAWLSGELLPRFMNRLLVLDAETILLRGELVSRLRQAGTPIPVMDSLIAATALYHHLTLVTRNEADFEDAVQAVSASGASCHYLATRNPGDYADQPLLNVIQPADLLAVGAAREAE